MKTLPHRIAFFLFSVTLCGYTAQANLEEGFNNPPNSSKPRTWMHAMSGNMSKVGMTKDLEALAAAGEGGVILFNIANTIPYGTVPYGSDEHHDIIRHAAKECERLGLSFGVHNCDGWSSSGGPWITPEQSMKMVVSSEAVVDGGNVNVELPQPNTVEGFYRDIAVLAYPALESEIIDSRAKPTITTSDKTFDIKTATDGWTDKAVTLQKTRGENPWILFDYGKPFAARSFDLLGHGHRLQVALETSDDGKTFTQAITLSRGSNYGKQRQAFSAQFAPITARYFRFSLSNRAELREVTLRSTAVYTDYIAHSGLGRARKHYNAIRTPEPSMIIPKDSIINLTSSFSKDGTLKAKLPEGKWTIMRVGYTSTGAINWPASKWGVGLECDKFSRPAFKTHFDAFCQRVIDDSIKEAPNALQYIEVDSYEMGGQTWTDGFEDMFTKEHGYDIIPFLPLFAGKYIESPELVSNVTWDLKKLYCDLMGNNYWDYFSELCHENGLVSYAEPYGNGPINGLDVCATMDIPMGEFWTTQPTAVIETPVSGAHIYGKPVISAEAFTSRTIENWKFHPAMAKTKGDEMWAKGINEFMFHRFTHQPNTHVKPGLTMARYGSHVDRTQTWWMNAGKAWFSYLSRGQFLLRQGHHVADVLIFTGDQPYNEAAKRPKEVPYSINYDSTNLDVLVNRIALKDQRMILPEGNPYSVLMLTNTDIMETPSLRRIKEIADTGIPVVGAKPTKLGGHNTSKADQAEFNALVKQIWDLPNCAESYDFTTIAPDFTVKGESNRIFMHRRTETEDIYFFSNPDEESTVYECTFRVANRIPEFWDPVSGSITKLARFQHEGDITRAWVHLTPQQSAFIVFRESSDGVTSIVEADDKHDYRLNAQNELECETSAAGTFPITLSDGTTLNVQSKGTAKPIDLSTDWAVEFLKEHDYAAIAPFKALTDWKDHADEKIKYYAGTAIYRKSFEFQGNLKASQKATLDLGEVNIAAEVLVNGKNVGTVWIAPFALNITEYLVEGNNELEVRITNQWTNRLIGDERFPKQDDGYALSTYNPKEDSSMPMWFLENKPMPEGPRTTFCSGQFYKKHDPLLPSGLVGPVTLQFKNVLNVSQ